MSFTTITADILIMHIVPYLTETEIRSLAQCNIALSETLGPLRFHRCSVRKYKGSFLSCLSFSTIKTIRHLILDGLATDHDDVFVCGDLSGVVSATIVTMIQPGQRASFGAWARQLETLREVDVADGEDIESSLSNLPTGSFQMLQSLRLDVSLPLGMNNALHVAPNLRRIQFLPTYQQIGEEAGYMYYLGELSDLLRLVSVSDTVPALKLLHIAPPSVTRPYEKVPHRLLMQNIWTAAHSHGGWKLQCEQPETFVQQANPHAWEWWWGRCAWDLTVTVKEIGEFIAACDRRDVFPRLSDYVRGRIHVQTSGGTAVMSSISKTIVYGVCVQHGPTTNMTAALNLVTNDTRILRICLRSLWGSVGHMVPDANNYQRIQALLMDGPILGHRPQHFDYQKNYCVAVVKGLAVRSWRGLVNLSLPAIAFQKAPHDGIPYLSKCGRHIGGFNMEWLTELTSLKWFSITDWVSCAACDLAADVCFDRGLTFVPPTVEFVSIGGRLGYLGVVEEWMKTYPADLRAILARNRGSVLVSFQKLSLVMIGTDALIPYVIDDANVLENSDRRGACPDAGGSSSWSELAGSRRAGRGSRTSGGGLGEIQRKRCVCEFSGVRRLFC